MKNHPDYINGQWHNNTPLEIEEWKAIDGYKMKQSGGYKWKFV